MTYEDVPKRQPRVCQRVPRNVHAHVLDAVEILLLVTVEGLPSL